MSEFDSEILDADIKKSVRTYAEKSFRKFIINQAIIFFGGFFLLNGGMSLSILPLFFIPAAIGFAQGIKSFRIKEENSWKKYVGFFGNLLLLLIPILIIGSILLMH